VLVTNELCDLPVSRIGLGTGRLASLGAGYSTRDARSLLHTAADLGVNLIDTADSYGSSDCETLLGRLLNELPGVFLISTKAGYPFAELPRPLKWLNQFGKKAMQRARLPQRFDKNYIINCIEGSLRRLRLERIDFFLLHDPPVAVLAHDGWREAVDGAMAAGKIRHFGISSPSAEIQSFALADPLCELIQAPFPCGFGQSDHALKPVVANHVFGRWAMAEQVAAIATKSGHTARSLLLAYAVSRAGIKCVLSGTGRAHHLRENIKALEIRLEPSVETELESALSGGVAEAVQR